MSIKFKRAKSNNDKFLAILVQHPELPDRVYTIPWDRLTDDDDIERIKQWLTNKTQRRLRRFRNAQRRLDRLFGEED